MTDIPSGFELFETNSPFNQLVGPYHLKRGTGKLVFGLKVQTKHCNTAGKLHGGMIGSIADIAIGHNIGMTVYDESQSKNEQGKPALKPASAIATVSMSTDYVGTAREGDWVEVHVDVQKAGRSLAFANAYFVCDEVRIARVSAVFKVFRET